MQVRDIMTSEVACCKRETPLQEVARMMVAHDCGAIPVVDSHASMVLQGIVTDRDIVLRSVAHERPALELTAEDCMTERSVKVTPEMTVDECSQIMAESRVRRLLVVNDAGRCCGIVALADIARRGHYNQAAEVARGVALPAGPRHTPLAVGG